VTFRPFEEAKKMFVRLISRIEKDGRSGADLEKNRNIYHTVLIEYIKKNGKDGEIGLVLVG
jgi:hypothetical protein